jgi:hypothetical protein
MGGHVATKRLSQLHKVCISRNYAKKHEGEERAAAAAAYYSLLNVIARKLVCCLSWHVRVGGWNLLYKG